MRNGLSFFSMEQPQEIRLQDGDNVYGLEQGGSPVTIVGEFVVVRPILQ